MDDTISRQAAIEVVKSLVAKGSDLRTIDRNIDICKARYEILKLPSAQPERKVGKWRLNRVGNWACPFCEFDPYHDNMNGMNYCPNCGARLKMPLADCGRRTEDVSQEEADVVEKLIEDITKRISERFIPFLEENYEIIPKKPVVRCKDCKHFVRSDGVCKALSINNELSVYVQDDNYCSNGERREER